ncbi:hypothetical protein [Thiococcus pfennigii]|uniref:hypothetical protein n=1 Tax=Thiococcus pfennigii TaxID=1057 RepID=UPI00190521B9|nr:hypothetical protein [Thiococcus pfennigii]MBK1699771.1 hypothetical protein [Thiococcus pfennigii]
MRSHKRAPATVDLALARNAFDGARLAAEHNGLDARTAKRIGQEAARMVGSGASAGMAVSRAERLSLEVGGRRQARQIERCDRVASRVERLLCEYRQKRGLVEGAIQARASDRYLADEAFDSASLGPEEIESAVSVASALDHAGLLTFAHALRVTLEIYGIQSRVRETMRKVLAVEGGA